MQQTGLSVMLRLARGAPQITTATQSRLVTVMDMITSTTKVALILQLTARYRQRSGCRSSG